MKTIMIRIPEELHSQFKVIAAKQKRTMTEILLKIIKKTIKEHNTYESQRLSS
jgi:predicted DNA-binding protein